MKERPYIICHMVTSIDGKILTQRWKDLTESKLTSKLYESIAEEFECGSWLVGTTTMQELTAKPRKLKAVKDRVPKGDFIANPEAKTHAIGTDSSGILRFKDDNVGGDHAIVITTEKASNAYLAHLRSNNVSYLICGKKNIDLKIAMNKLSKKFKLEKVLLEGGGVINGAMLQEGLIDEISQIIVPIVDGGGQGVSGLFDLKGKSPKKAVAGLELMDKRSLEGGAQWLHFSVQY